MAHAPVQLALAADVAAVAVGRFVVLPPPVLARRHHVLVERRPDLAPGRAIQGDLSRAGQIRAQGVKAVRERASDPVASLAQLTRNSPFCARRRGPHTARGGAELRGERHGPLVAKGAAGGQSARARFLSLLELAMPQSARTRTGSAAARAPQLFDIQIWKQRQRGSP